MSHPPSPAQVVHAFCVEDTPIAQIAKSAKVPPDDVETILENASHGKYTHDLHVMMFYHKLSKREPKFKFSGRELVLAVSQMGVSIALIAKIFRISENTARNRLAEYEQYPWVGEWKAHADTKFKEVKFGIPFAHRHANMMMCILVGFTVLKWTRQEIKSHIGLPDPRIDEYFSDATRGRAGIVVREMFEMELERRKHDTTTGLEAMLLAYDLPAIPDPQQRAMTPLPGMLVVARFPAPPPISPVVSAAFELSPVVSAALVRSPTPPTPPVVSVAMERSPTPPMPPVVSVAMERSPTPPVQSFLWPADSPVESDLKFGDPWEDALSFFDPPEDQFPMDDY